MQKKQRPRRKLSIFPEETGSKRIRLFLVRLGGFPEGKGARERNRITRTESVFLLDAPHETNVETLGSFLAWATNEAKELRKTGLKPAIRADDAMYSCAFTDVHAHSRADMDSRMHTDCHLFAFPSTDFFACQRTYLTIIIQEI